MGEIEEMSTKRRKRRNLKKLILNTLFVSGGVAVALVAPNVLGALGKMGYLPSPRHKDAIAAARQRLIRQGLVVYHKGLLRITSKGERELRLLDSGAYLLKHSKKWDGRWRVLIFDIPERRRALRAKLRRTLTTVGFTRLQDSVWLYPYDCEDFTALLKADFRIGKDLLYLIVDSLEGDARYRRHFSLPVRS